MNDSQGRAWTYAEAVEWWQYMTSYQGWVSCILYDPNELESMVAAMIAEVERLRAELAAAKAASVVPVEVLDCYYNAMPDLGEVRLICKSGSDAQKVTDWLRERMKGGEG